MGNISKGWVGEMDQNLGLGGTCFLCMQDTFDRCLFKVSLRSFSEIAIFGNIVSRKSLDAEQHRVKCGTQGISNTYKVNS